jgi:hypothetical protein
MKFGLTLGAILLASNVAFAQVAIDMPTLERKVEDAQAAYDRNPVSADRQEISDIRDELGYLRVKQRLGQAVTRTERMRLNDRVDRYLQRSARASGVYDRTTRDDGRIRDNRTTSQGRTGLEIPSGSEVDVRLLTALTSDTAQVEDRVEATTMIDLYRGNELLVPAGSTLTGWVTSVDRASRTDRKGSLTIEFNRVRINNRNYDTKAYVTQALESELVSVRDQLATPDHDEVYWLETVLPDGTVLPIDLTWTSGGWDWRVRGRLWVPVVSRIIFHPSIRGSRFESNTFFAGEQAKECQCEVPGALSQRPGCSLGLA